MALSLDSRKKTVFHAVVREYLRSAEPVGSGTLVERYRLDVSPATIRNDMVDLEERGLLEQPHTSSGRIPTEDGYRFYVDEFVQQTVLRERERKIIEMALAAIEEEKNDALKVFMKSLASMTEETVFASFGDHTWYIVGMTNLLHKPEFRETNLFDTLSVALEDFDEIISDCERRLTSDIEIFIGTENPFGSALSAVLTTGDVPGVGEGIVGILGPTRMDYDTNAALLRYVHEFLRN